MPKLSPSDRLAAGHKECWGLYDDGDETWLTADKRTWKKNPGKRFDYGSEKKAGRHTKRMNAVGVIQPRRFWRRKKPKPQPAPGPFELGQWVTGKVNPRGPWRVIEINTPRMPPGCQVEVQSIEVPELRIFFGASRLEAMAPGAIPLEVGDIVEIVNPGSGIHEKRGRICRGDGPRLYVVDIDGMVCTAAHSELRLIRRDPKPEKQKEEPLKIGDAAEVLGTANCDDIWKGQIGRISNYDSKSPCGPFGVKLFNQTDSLKEVFFRAHELRKIPDVCEFAPGEIVESAAGCLAEVLEVKDGKMRVRWLDDPQFYLGDLFVKSERKPEPPEPPEVTAARVTVAAWDEKGICPRVATMAFTCVTHCHSCGLNVPANKSARTLEVTPIKCSIVTNRESEVSR